MNQERGQRETVVAVLAGDELPRVGDGATEQLWSDSHAYTVAKILSPKCIVVQRDKATCTSFEHQDYTYERDETAPTAVLVFKVTKRYPKGRWVRKDEPRGNSFVVGYRREYRSREF